MTEAAKPSDASPERVPAALAIADRAYLLETGRIVMSGPAADIRKDEAVRRSYLGY